jgi:hypothetical protein
VNNDELERIWLSTGRGLILRCYSGIHLEGLRKTTKTLNQDTRSPGPHEYEPGVLSTQPRHSFRGGSIKPWFRYSLTFSMIRLRGAMDREESQTVSLSSPQPHFLAVQPVLTSKVMGTHVS